MLEQVMVKVCRIPSTRSIMPRNGRNGLPKKENLLQDFFFKKKKGEERNNGPKAKAARLHSYL